MITWPWSQRAGTGSLVLGGLPERLLWLHAAGPLGQPGALLGGGELAWAAADSAAAARALRDLGLPLRQAVAVLPLQQSQWLQIETPAVPPDELRAAARWRVKELVEGRVDELTLDVMQVGDGRERAHSHVFVAAASRERVDELGRLAQEAGLALTVVDVAEAAQRNLIAAHAAARGLRTRAVAGLVRHGAHCLLTIGAGDELFYARRIDWDGQAMAPAAAASFAAGGDDGLESLDFVDYGAETAAPVAADGLQHLVIELQRSFDVWERTWTDLPLAGVVLALGDAGAAAAEAIVSATGLRVEALDVEALFPGYAALAGSSEMQEALLPLLGELLRAETSKL
ncbi:conserved hypothetical protein [Rubrivivax sp. A210]|uniref:pilus assembly protein PilM n=1 Tax=Rubrivivax sp. A210 TaxID=2772301 RepID=UPI00191A3C29|nr:pilus assembly protein PilM [Rubrivivax sp. A210]CAD5370285.1 conserved hypothetical protein [Rubrivivax sp. A210]